MYLKVIYDCGCESAGHNVHSFCPNHDRPVREMKGTYNKLLGYSYDPDLYHLQCCPFIPNIKEENIEEWAERLSKSLSLLSD